MKLDFKALGIGAELNEALLQNGITEPMPVQEQAIPAILQSDDVIAQAQTGTGKTLAFLLPIMEMTDTQSHDVQSLIVAPTRELAIQITAEAKKLAEARGVSILSVYGGQDVEQQLRKLKNGVHMVIATPGRLLDHIRRKSINLKKLRMLVLDEADEMLNMGFLSDVEAVIHQTPKDRQTLLFSATMPKDIRALASRYMNSPAHIKVQGSGVTLDGITQLVVETTDRGKQEALLRIIDEHKPFMSIIFCRTKHRAKALNELLTSKGFSCDELHGDITQAKREKVMKEFRKTRLQFLVATDVAARGLDVEGMTHVFNYDMPFDAENYIHRIGRTGRAGQTGVAVTFATPRDAQTLALIENEIRMVIKRRRMTDDKDMNSKKKGPGARGEAFVKREGHKERHGESGPRSGRRGGQGGPSKFGKSAKSEGGFNARSASGKSGTNPRGASASREAGPSRGASSSRGQGSSRGRQGSSRGRQGR